MAKPNPTFIYIIIILFQLFSLQKAFTQDTSKTQVIIFTDADSSIAKIESEKITQFRKPFLFKPGDYLLKIWAPGRVLLTDSVHFLPGQINLVRKKLAYSEDYKEYLSFRSKIRKPLRITKIGSASIAVLYAFNFYEMQHYRKKADDAYYWYSQSLMLDDLQKKRSEFESQHDRYNLHRKINNILTVGAGVLIPAAFIYAIKYYKKRYKPYHPKEILLSEIN